MINLEKLEFIQIYIDISYHLYQYINLAMEINLYKSISIYINPDIQRSTLRNFSALLDSTLSISMLRQEVDQHGSIIVAPADAWHAWHREKVVNQRGDPMVMEHSYGKPPIYR